MGEPTSEKAGKKHNAVIEDDELERVLNQVDERTQIQQLFHEHLSNGFMSLARERYRDPSSAERLGRLVYDNREKVRSSVHVQLKERRDKVLSIYKIHPSERHESSEDVVDAQLRRRRVSSRREHHEDSIVENVHHNTGGVQVNVSNSFMPIPSSEVREAIRHFRLAVDAAIEIADRNFLLTAAITEVEQ